MYFKTHPYLIIIILFTLAGCKKNNGPTTNTPTDTNTTGTDVYAVGYSTVNAHIIATYWKNGVPTTLHNSLNADSFTTGIAIQGNDIYVTGFYENPVNGYSIACYWKNGVITVLSTGQSHDMVSAITIKGNDVYLIGTVGNKAMLWKNNVPLAFDNPDVSVLNAISIQGNDIFMAGSTRIPSLVYPVAAYWKNGTITILSNKFSVATCIALNGSDVHVAGTISPWPYYNFYNLNNTDITYWKNGVATSFGDTSSVTSTTANAIVLKGTDVYIVGQIETQTSYDIQSVSAAATYWKNGVPTMLTDINIKHSSSDAFAVAIQGDDIYVAGDSFIPGIATYWKNGVPVQLEPTSLISSVIRGIVIITH